MTFTKEQLIEQAKNSIERYTKAVAGFPRHLNVAMDLELARIALASLTAEPVAINDDMAYAFHHALTDGALGADEVEEIKTGLRAAFANVTAPPAPVSVPDDLYKIANHIASAKGGLPNEWQDWAEEIETDIRRAAMLQGAEPVSQRDELPYDPQIAAYEKIMEQAIPDGWVPCSERMPEKCDFDIWVFSPSRGVIDGLQWDGSMFADDEYQFTIHDATHWMRKIYPAGPTEQPARDAYEIERFGIFSVTELSDGLNFRIEQFHFEHENHIESAVPKFALQAIINRLQEHCDGMGIEPLMKILPDSAAPQQEA